MTQPPTIEGLQEHADLQREFAAAWRALQINCPSGCQKGALIQEFQHKLHARRTLAGRRRPR